MTVVKSIVVCLALANMVYFMWTHGIATSQETAAPARAAALKLVSEVPPSTRPAAPGGNGSEESIAGAAADPGGAERAGLPSSVKRCITVGPFRDVAEAAHAAGTLRRAGYDPRQRVVDGEVWAGIWVYLSISANNTGEQLLAKLKGAGIEDALQMPGPVDGSVISLGLFSEERRAQARIAQLHALGLNPGIADRKRIGNVYWVDIDLQPTEGLLNPADLQGEAGHITRLEVKACPAGAAQP